MSRGLILLLASAWMTSIFSQTQLSDPKIRKILKEAGISSNQAKNIIGQQSLNDGLIDTNKIMDGEKIKKQVKTIRQLDKSVVPNIQILPAPTLNKTDELSKDSNNRPLINDETIEKIQDENSKAILDDFKQQEEKINYYGYNVFDGDPEIFQASINESIDPNYLIGPGDEIIIMLWGETEINKTYTISKDGYLFIPNVGQVFVNSYTLSKLEKKLFRLLKKVYSSLEPNSGSATTFFDVSLGSISLRPLRIFVLGEVHKPGAYSVKPSATFFTSLYYFDGPKVQGSLRKIELIRNEEKIAEIDFYDYLQTGKRIGDINLQRDDVIYIPPRGKTVRTYGEINRNKIFELKENENINDLIKFAGGLKSTTYIKHAQIDRIIPAEQRDSLNIERTKVDFNLNFNQSSSDQIGLFDGDVINFFRIKDKHRNIVQIIGPVKRPGLYDLGSGLKLRDLIIKADSLEANVYLNRADIVRINHNDDSREHIDINLGLALKKDPSHNIELKSNDIISVYSFGRMTYRSNVSIIGHVINPGQKQYMKDMQIYDLVFLGGGFENKKHLKNTYLERADLIKKDENNAVTEIVPFRLDSVLVGKGIANNKVEMGDEIKIYSIGEISYIAKNIVTVSGVVKKPGQYPITEKSRLLDLLFRAGGIDDEKFRENIFMERVDIIRENDENDTKKIIEVNLWDVLDTNNNINPYLKTNDVVRVYSNLMFEKVKKVKISGEIRSPGEYALKTNMSIDDLILEAGGVSNKNNSYKLDLSRRLNNTSSIGKKVETFTYNFSGSKNTFLDNYNNNISKIKLKDEDDITIRKHPYFEALDVITIKGKVLYPGNYILESTHDKVSDIIKRAGGLRHDAYAMASSLTRGGEEIRLSFDKLIKSPKSSSNFYVLNGDIIFIGSKSNLVKIEGQINTPGNYQFIKGKKLSDYVEGAGGLTENANRNGIYVDYPDGSSKKQNVLGFSPKIMDGSIIYVGSKEETEPFNLTEYVTNVTQIWADITQAYILILLTFRSSNG